MMRYRCPGCGYAYDEARGDAHQGFAPGTTWAQLPVNWPCPDCAVNEKEDFEPVPSADDGTSDGDRASDGDGGADETGTETEIEKGTETGTGPRQRRRPR